MTTKNRTHAISRLAEVRAQLASSEADISAARTPSRRTPTQLALVEAGPRQPWDLDEETRHIGRQGVANARAILRAARPVHLDIAA